MHLRGGERIWKNEIEWTGKVEISKEEFPAAGKAFKTIFWPTPGFKDRTFHSAGFLAYGTLISTSTASNGGENGDRTLKKIKLNELGGQKLARQISWQQISRKGYNLTYSRF